MAEPQRIAKLMAQRGLCSRREAERLIAAGAVMVDGERIGEQGSKASPQADIRIVGRRERVIGKRLTVILNKPPGIVSTQPEGRQIPAWSLLDAAHAAIGTDAATIEHVVGDAPRFNVAGRLDRDSRGLLLLTTDGRVVKAVTGGHALRKVYQVRVTGTVDEECLRRLNGPLTLDGRRLRAMRVEAAADDLLRFELHEGRKHQIRRLCQQQDLRVVDLQRIALGPWELAALPEGRWRAVDGEAVLRS